MQVRFGIRRSAFEARTVRFCVDLGANESRHLDRVPNALLCVMNVAWVH